MNILLIIAVVLWFLAAIPLPTKGIGLGWLGMALFGLSMVIK